MCPKILKPLVSLFLALLIFTEPLYIHATSADYQAEAEERKHLTVQSNQIENWPQGPAIGAEAAILIEANTGAVLYAKNIDEELPPASITKLLCALVAIENSSLDELVTVNQSAINANDSDGSSMYLTAGEVLTMEELLYGVLINSANEACNAIGEHIAGSIDAYVDMMNARATELGCTHSHFVTTNGLHREGHYTSAHDMALIAQAFFSHDILCRMSSTTNYTLPETDTHAAHSLHSKNKLYEGGTYEYDGIVGSKTGFTSHSRQTLVSCAERGDIRLICVILKEESPYQFEDTVALFDYGFAHFHTEALSGYETGYGMNSAEFFTSGSGIFGETDALVAIDPDARLLLPDTLSYEDLNSAISYDNLEEDEIARIVYTYRGITLGSAPVYINRYTDEINFSTYALGGVPATETQESVSTENAADTGTEVISETPVVSENTTTPKEERIYINVYHVLLYIVGGVAVLIVGALLVKLIRFLMKKRRRAATIRRRYGEVVKSRSTLRKNFRSDSHGANPLTFNSSRNDGFSKPRKRNTKNGQRRSRKRDLRMPEQRSSSDRHRKSIRPDNWDDYE